MSTTLPAGLPMVSQNTALVLSSIKASSAAMSSCGANFTVMPWRGQVWAKRLYVPPYSLLIETMLAPAGAMVCIAYVMAAIPSATVIYALPLYIASTSALRRDQLDFII